MSFLFDCVVHWSERIRDNTGDAGILRLIELRNGLACNLQPNFESFKQGIHHEHFTLDTPGDV